MTDWDARYREGDMPWEKGYPAPPLREVLAKHGVEIWGRGTVLVPGCGFGHDVRELAGAGLMVLGVDIATSAVENARGFQRAGEEAYELGDFLDPAWPAGRKFSAMWEHTCFCAIDPSRRDDYQRAAVNCLEDGGLLAGVFFLNPSSESTLSDGPPFGVKIEELQDRFGGDFTLLDSWVPATAYPGREGREWIALFRKNPLPAVAGGRSAS